MVAAGQDVVVAEQVEVAGGVLNERAEGAAAAVHNLAALGVIVGVVAAGAAELDGAGHLALVAGGVAHDPGGVHKDGRRGAGRREAHRGNDIGGRIGQHGGGGRVDDRAGGEGLAAALAVRWPEGALPDALAIGGAGKGEADGGAAAGFREDAGEGDGSIRAEGDVLRREGLQEAGRDGDARTGLDGGVRVQGGGDHDIGAVGGEIAGRRVLAGGGNGAGTAGGVAARDGPGDGSRASTGEGRGELLHGCAAGAVGVASGAVGVNGRGAGGDEEGGVGGIGGHESAAASGKEQQGGRCHPCGEAQPCGQSPGTRPRGLPQFGISHHSQQRTYRLLAGGPDSHRFAGKTRRPTGRALQPLSSWKLAREHHRMPVLPLAICFTANKSKTIRAPHHPSTQRSSAGKQRRGVSERERPCIDGTPRREPVSKSRAGQAVPEPR